MADPAGRSGIRQAPVPADVDGNVLPPSYPVQPPHYPNTDSDEDLDSNADEDEHDAVPFAPAAVALPHPYSALTDHTF